MSILRGLAGAAVLTLGVWVEINAALHTDTPIFIILAGTVGFIAVATSITIPPRPMERTSHGHR